MTDGYQPRQTRTTRTPAFLGYPRRLMITHTIVSCWIPSQNKVEWPWRYRSRSSHATHLLILVIICTKYGKNPSRTVDAPERTRFSRSRANDLENIGQGPRSLHATHPLMLMMVCAKYGKNASRIVDFFFNVKAKKLEQGKSEGFDSCDRPCNLYQIWSKSSIFQPVWPWNFMNDVEK